jgi:hypothetical protein
MWDIRLPPPWRQDLHPSLSSAASTLKMGPRVRREISVTSYPHAPFNIAEERRPNKNAVCLTTATSSTVPRPEMYCRRDMLCFQSVLPPKGRNTHTAGRGGQQLVISFVETKRSICFHELNHRLLYVCFYPKSQSSIQQNIRVIPEHSY